MPPRKTPCPFALRLRMPPRETLCPFALRLIYSAGWFMRRRLLSASIFLLASAPRFVAAEGTPPSLDVRGFHPSADPQSGIYYEPASSPKTFDWSAGLWLSYALLPVALRNQADEIAFRVIEHQLSGDVTASLGIAERAMVGVDLPFLLYQGGDAPTADSIYTLGDTKLPHQALGDLGILGKLTLIKPTGGEFGGFALALHERFTAPTGDEASYLGEGSVTSETRLLAEYRLLALSVHFAAGVKLRAAPEAFACAYLAAGESEQCPTRLGHELPFGLSVALRPQVLGIDPAGRWTWFAEAHGYLPLSPITPFEERAVSSMQIGLGARFVPLRDYSLLAGVETAVIKGIGTGPLRAMLSVSWAPRTHDADSDGVDDEIDQCPGLVEDRDGFEDDDGCPEGDNDDDGVPDGSDRCPAAQEDEDGHADDDGCPDPDNDGDRIIDTMDGCPNDPGPQNPDPAKNGCPVRDPDGDGIEGEQDRCPDAPEDKDDFQDDDGCPDPDNDGDGINDTEDACPTDAGTTAENPKDNGCPDPDPDHDAISIPDDKCPDAAEVYNGTDDDDGCPDGDPDKPAKPLVTVKDTKDGPVVELAAAVKFTEQNEIEPASMPLLRALATELMKHAGWTVAVGVRPSFKGGPNEALIRAFAVVDALRKRTRREGVAETVSWSAVKDLPRAAQHGIGWMILTGSGD